MKPAWHIREYREGDENLIFELASAVHGAARDRERWMRWWYWMYRDNPAGTGKIWVAEHEGRIVGHYALISQHVKIGEEIQKVCQNVDDMTHPDYRYRGIYAALEKRALDEAGKAGANITIGFPNDAAYPGHIKLGWHDLCSIETMIKPLNPLNILGKYLPNRLLAKICAWLAGSAMNLFLGTGKPAYVDGLVITRMKSFDDRIDSLWSKVSKYYEIIGVRNKDYLNWRYINIPGVDYTIYMAEREGQIAGYIVLKRGELRGLACGYIFDLIVAPGEVEIARHLVLKAIEHFKQEKVDLILYQMIGPKAYHDIFRKSGFIISRFISRRFRFIIYLHSPKISEKLVKNPGHWFVQVGDSDAT